MLGPVLEIKKLDYLKELQAWQCATQLANKIHDITQHFPKEEKFRMASHMRCMATSIVSDIAEGSQGESKREFLRLAMHARDANAELLMQLLLSRDKKYVSDADFSETYQLIDEVSRVSMRLVQSLRQSL